LYSATLHHSITPYWSQIHRNIPKVGQYRISVIVCLFSQAIKQRLNFYQPYVMAKHESKKYFDDNGNLIIKPYRMLDLAAIFDVNYRTMKRWMSNFPNELGKKNGLYYSIHQVQFMIAQFGLPRRVQISTTEQQLNKAA
jgi:hypothetical protein